MTGVALVSDDNTQAAGVSRFLQPFSAIVQGDKIAQLHLTYEEGDAQTRTYLEYLAGLEDDDGGPPLDGLEVTLGPGRDGSQTGSAFIFEESGLAFVGIEVAPGAAGVLQPAHVHAGDCPGTGAVVSPLASVLDGSSFTILSLSKAELRAGNFAINVHKSAAESAVYMACGEVEGTAAAPSPVASPPAATATAAPGGIIAPSTGSGPGGEGTDGTWPLAAAALVGVLLMGAGTAVYVARRTD